METLATTKPTAQGKIRPLSRRRTIGRYYSSKEELCEDLAIRFSSSPGQWQAEYKTRAEANAKGLSGRRLEEHAGNVPYEEQIKVECVV